MFNFRMEDPLNMLRQMNGTESCVCMELHVQPPLYVTHLDKHGERVFHAGITSIQQMSQVASKILQDFTKPGLSPRQDSIALRRMALQHIASHPDSDV